MFVTGNPFQLILMFASTVRAYPIGPFSDARFHVKLWPYSQASDKAVKRLPGTNNLAY